MNRCWFAVRVVAVKPKYRLTVDAREARAHGIAPVRRGHPAYRLMRDGDDVVCE